MRKLRGISSGDGVATSGPARPRGDCSGTSEIGPSFSASFIRSFVACPSRISRQAASGSWTKSRQWETQRTLFNSARTIVWPPANVNCVWPSNDAWLRATL